MPYAVVHMLLPMMLLDFLRHKFLKNKKSLPNRYILIVGLAGLLPDIDIPVSYLFSGLVAHRGITHTVWVSLLFLLVSAILQFAKKHDMAKIFLMVSIGAGSHVALDILTAGSLQLFYPLSKAYFSVNLIPKIFPHIGVTFAYAVLDALLLFGWIATMILRRRVKDII